MTDFDSPWKIIMAHFEDLMAFFYPQVHAGIDWTQPIDFQDSELQKELRTSETGRLHVDKVAKVITKAGQGEVIVLHVEAQGDVVENMPERVYVYNCTLFLHHRLPVVSLVLYTDLSASWQPDTYEFKLFGFHHWMKFPTAKLLNYEGREDELERDPNVFALVVLAQLRAKRTRENNDGRLSAKRRLLRLLFQRKLAGEKVRDLLKFIDWVLTLPDTTEQLLWQEVRQWEEVKTMYLASFEREPFQQGFNQGKQSGFVEGKESGFESGFVEGRQSIVCSMLNQGLDYETIAKFTGLSVEEIVLLSKKAS